MSLRFPVLRTIESPWVLLDEPSREDLKILPDRLYSEPSDSILVRKLRGTKMGTQQDLMDEFGAALQFFDAFGENWHALKDCLTSLNDWMPAPAYLLVITSPEQVLGDEKRELRWLLATLSEAGSSWAEPIVNNGPYNRPAIPFHTIFQADATQLDRLPPELADLPRLRGSRR